MANLKSLAKDTAIYGMSSIIGRFLNYLLVPLYTHVISAASGGYGIVTNLYAYVALILVILTFGMETTFFRFANKDDEDPRSVFITSIGIVTTLSLSFMALVSIFQTPLCAALGYADHPEYVLMMAAVVSLDAIQAIPFSLLRYQKKAIKFAALKMLFIALNIGSNIVYFLLLDHHDVWGIFMLNLACTSIITFFFIPEVMAIIRPHNGSSNSNLSSYGGGRGEKLLLLRRMLSYSWPILILGIAGILNQAFDKMIFPWAYTHTGLHTTAEAQVQLGIYGACVKIAMIMAMITQAFRYAYEPIVFAKAKDRDSKEYYAVAMKYFIIFTLLAFLCVVGYMDILKHIVRSDYHAGLITIPIVMIAEIMMGIYFNLSFWYKLIDKTIWGAWFSLAGCAVLIIVNILFIPHYGYLACAWGGVAGYGTAMTLSYIVGQHKNPINYPLKSIATYTLMTILFYVLMTIQPTTWPAWLHITTNTIIILAFIAHIYWHEIRHRKTKKPTAVRS